MSFPLSLLLGAFNLLNILKTNFNSVNAEDFQNLYNIHKNIEELESGIGEAGSSFLELPAASLYSWHGISLIWN